MFVPIIPKQTSDVLFQVLPALYRTEEPIFAKYAMERMSKEQSATLEA